MNFWKTYEKLDEIEQRKRLESLPIKYDKDGFMKHMTLTLFKSYIDDAIEKRI